MIGYINYRFCGKKKMEEKKRDFDGTENSSFAPNVIHLSVLFPVAKQSLFLESRELPRSPKAKGCNSVSPFLVTTLQIASLVGYAPFHIKFDSDAGSYSIRPVHIIRKLLCATQHILVIGHLSWYNVQSGIISSEALPTKFTRTFDFVASLGSQFLSILLAYTFWRKQNDVLRIVEATRISCERGSIMMIHKLVSLAIFAVAYLGCISVYLTIQTDVIVETGKDLVPPLKGASNILFSITRMACNALFYHSAAFQYYTVNFIIIICVSMRGVKNEFCSTLKETVTTLPDVKRGLEHYIRLKQLSSDITQIFGSHVLIYYIISVAHFAKLPEKSVWNQSGQTVSMIVYFSLGAAVWLIAAEFHMKVREVVQNWATQMQDREDLPVDMRIRLMSIVNDNLLDPIGISCKFFTITYGFLGSMLGLIVTYAIIVFQMQAKPNNV